MDSKLQFIKSRINPTHFSKLWNFYRDCFSNESECISFLFKVFEREPIIDYFQLFGVNNPVERNSTQKEYDIDDRVFIPRRMVNVVERLVSAARDMEKIRKGKDIYKIIFIVTCVESLQSLKGYANRNNNEKKKRKDSKKDMMIDFFCNATSEETKQFLADNFDQLHFDQFNEDSEGEKTDNKKEDAAKSLAVFLYKFRNSAVHEGRFGDSLFSYDEEYPLSISYNDGYSNDKIEYWVNMSYSQFEQLFVQSCIRFINIFIEEMK